MSQLSDDIIFCLQKGSEVVKVIEIVSLKKTPVDFRRTCTIGKVRPDPVAFLVPHVLYVVVITA